ncbi:GDYXXLXY domain-containing protein [Rhizobium rosettiformans]|uniref:GDYXXLXY domain-containing protein n=1 Tax=Rhizobium rosettiformans TaxID=1368430 RepID=UPI002861DB7B|nr:GDYXXLXY domain-containing protein [Rhizobium rosettiformans]MDR7027464.1 putative membrane-anchored protein [Rhizobium rosettiformans]MDR7065585.1 putative membrane-anchored protein [Rhizobium rosettiformans]
MIAARPFAAVALAMALLQTAILGYMIEGRAGILRSGTEVLLKTAPVDPRDLLRGDYVILTYDVSTISTTSIIGQKPETGDAARLHVRLKPGADGFWTVSEASFDPLPVEDGSVVLLSQPVTIYDWEWQNAGNLTVSYGIERFYVPEGEGRPIEDGRNEGRVSVAARVSEDGQAQIRTLMLDGEPLYEEPLY